MLKKEAAKLKAKVQEASLAAAKAAEEAEQKLEEMVEKVMDETDATREEVENIVSCNFQVTKITKRNNSSLKKVTTFEA